MMRLSLSQAPIFSPSLQVKQEEPNYKGSVSELREIIEESRGFMEMSYAERKALNDMTGSRYLIVPRFVQDTGIDQGRYAAARELYLDILTAIHRTRPIIQGYNFSLSDYMFFLTQNPLTSGLVATRDDIGSLVERFMFHLEDRTLEKGIAVPLPHEKSRLQLRRDMLDQNNVRYILEGDDGIVVGFKLPLDLYQIWNALNPMFFHTVTNLEGGIIYEGVENPVDMGVVNANLLVEERVILEKTPIALSALLAERGPTDAKLKLGTPFKKREVLSATAERAQHEINIEYTPITLDENPILELSHSNVKFHRRSYYSGRQLEVALNTLQAIYENMLFSVIIGGNKPPVVPRPVLEGIRFVDEIVTVTLYKRIIEESKSKGRSLITDKKKILAEQSFRLHEMGLEEYTRTGRSLIQQKDKLARLV